MNPVLQMAMVAAGIISAPPVIPDYGVLLLHMDGTNGGASFIDDYNHTITVVGNVTTSTAQSKFGGASLLMGTSSNGIKSVSSDFAFGTGNFTIEAWVYMTALPLTNAVIVGTSTAGVGGIQLRIRSTGALSVYDDASAASILEFGTISLNTWTHIACTKQSNFIRLFKDGVQQTNGGNATDYTGTTLSVGMRYSDNQNFTGYIDEVRVLKGEAAYTGNFTPASVAFSKPAATGTGDPYFFNTSLLLKGDGTNATQNNTFIDSSTNNSTITRTGTPTQGSLSPFSPAGWCGDFNGTTDYLSFANNAAYQFGSANFSIECGLFYRGTTGHLAGCAGNVANTRGWYIDIQANRAVAFYWYYDGNTAQILTTTATVPLNAWCHVAVVKSGTTVSIFIDGTNKVTATLSGTISAAASQFLEIGREARYPGAVLNAMISNFRINKTTLPDGYDATLSSLPVPTAPLTAVAGTSVLTLQNNRFVDNSTNNFAITVVGTPKIQATSPFNPTVAYSPAVHGGSGYFGGSNGDYLSIADSAAFNLSATAFTIEAWVYRTATNAGYIQWVVGKRGNTNPFYCYWCLGFKDGKPSLYANNTTVSATNVTPLNTWAHIAITHDGTSFRIYENGVLVLGPTAITISNISTPVDVGAIAVDTAVGQAGNYHSIRIVKGAVVYTGNFTPPTAPLQKTGAASAASYPSTTNVNTTFADSACSLLLNFTNAGIVDSTAKNNLTTVGNAQINTTAKKMGSGSMSFNGTTDFLRGTGTNSLAFGTGDFTTECWVYSTASAIQGIVCLGAGATTHPYFYINGTTPTLFFNNGGVATGPAISLNTWVHVAVTRQSGSIRVWTNGTSGTAVTNTTSLNCTGLFIGASDAPAQFLSGYIDDLRITKGVARYLGNFTPTTTTFSDVGGNGTDPHISNVSLLMHMDGANAGTTFTDVKGKTVTRVGAPVTSTAQSRFGGASGLFNGTTDYLSLAASSDFEFPGDFTIEFFLYVNAGNSATPTVVALNGAGMHLRLANNGAGLTWYTTNGSTWAANANAATTLVGRWAHIAMVRVGTTATLYVDGVAQVIGGGNSTFSGTAGSSAAVPTIGGSAGSFCNCYIDELRITKGIARYAGNFPVPTTAFLDA